jgi:hypothetical protein
MSSRPVLGSGPTHPPIQSAPWWGGGLSTGVKRPSGEADHSLPTSAEIKNTWICTATPRLRMHGVVLNYLRTGTTYTWYNCRFIPDFGNSFMHIIKIVKLTFPAYFRRSISISSTLSRFIHLFYLWPFIVPRWTRFIHQLLNFFLLPSHCLNAKETSNDNN